jgi:hypothetical protein
MRIFTFAASLLFLYLIFFTSCHAESAISLGYGFGAWNAQGAGRVEHKAPYDYATFSYLYEKLITSSISLVLEPYLGVVNRPHDGIDAGFYLYGKWYFTDISPSKWFYATFGTGAAYTSMNFHEQGTHGLFVIQAGIGYRSGRFFIEDRLHHYSNGGLAKPNRSVNSNLIKIGYFL